MRTLSGLGVSAGVGQAHALVVSPAPGLPASDPSRGAEADLAKVEAALGKVADRLDERSLHADPSALAVLQATAMMARDPGLLTSVKSHLSDGHGPAHALWAAFDDFCAQLSAAGGYLAERVTDLRNVRDRAVAVMQGLPEPGCSLL